MSSDDGGIVAKGASAAEEGRNRLRNGCQRNEAQPGQLRRSQDVLRCSCRAVWVERALQERLSTPRGAMAAAAVPKRQEESRDEEGIR